MRKLILIVGFVVAGLFVGPAMRWQTILAQSAPSANSANSLCGEGKVICVSESIAHSLISNPMRFDVVVNSPDQITVAWELDDSAGGVLEASSTDEYVNLQAANSSPTRTLPRTLHIQDFIFKVSPAASGTLILRPSRTSASGKNDLPALKIPVRLATASTQVTTLQPQDSAALHSAIVEWQDRVDHPEFNPQVKLVPHQVEVMRVDGDAIIGVTAEAVLRANRGQGAWHVTGWRQNGGTAHVTLNGDGWAGVSYYLTGVQYLIRKSLLNVPGIKEVVFDPPQ